MSEGMDIDVIDERGERKRAVRIHSFEDLLALFAQECCDRALGIRGSGPLETLWSAVICKHIAEKNRQYELGVKDGKDMAND